MSGMYDPYDPAQNEALREIIALQNARAANPGRLADIRDCMDMINTMQAVSAGWEKLHSWSIDISGVMEPFGIDDEVDNDPIVKLRMECARRLCICGHMNPVDALVEATVQFDWAGGRDEFDGCDDASPYFEDLIEMMGVSVCYIDFYRMLSARLVKEGIWKE